MKRKVWLALPVSLALVSGLFRLNWSWAQDPLDEPLAGPPALQDPAKASARRVRVVEQRVLPDGRSVFEEREVEEAARPIASAAPRFPVSEPSRENNLLMLTVRNESNPTSAESLHLIEQATRKFRDAESDEERATAKKELAELLDKYFEEDMQRRAEEIAKIEERVKKLRDLLEKRAAKKKEIIDLQIKVLENEAAGLGFFSQPGLPSATKWYYNEPGEPWSYRPPGTPAAGATEAPASRGPFDPPRLRDPQLPAGERYEAR